MSTAQYATDQPAGFKNRIEKVAIVGAGGTIGSFFTKELLKTGKHTVTALTRTGSKSTLPEGVKVANIDYDNHESIVTALRGNDFLIVTLSVRAAPEVSGKLFAAAEAAGVEYVMPNAYGPNPHNTLMYEDMGFGSVFRTACAEIAKRNLIPVILSCGFWYEFSLTGGTSRFGFDLANRKAVFFDNGDVKTYTSTWPQCGRAAAALLSLPILPKDAADKSPTLSTYAGTNKSAYISSFHVSQKDMYESVKRVSGTTDADWTVSHEPTKERHANAAKALQSGGGVKLDGVSELTAQEAFATLMYTRVFFPGGDGLKDVDIANKALGLPLEDIDIATKEAFRMVRDGDLDTYSQ
ncbi:isoflavone reductase family protein [Grosmannia clavigera kw1407]|uniref:Isoflavone reductase family protein n=1 Tax=Grosmannia clavigera (strain kw1407 / UAMH 11150) TaxID=655863 RepID=F0XJB2_GROCL|nr:isoflavone reductase family protein [Grosmannia clavigera kw1407]EFX02248.1 isoflavone reductase family protein [Grosmannia clavigera kw1407]